MELVLVNSVNTLVELDMGASMESLGDFLDSQRELFHCQIDQLQKIVVTQCKLTGVNPLSQEMAAGALSIKIGKRPRDLLNPKAIKYMQSLFSIKDTFGKKETREISALCGVTITQVREFFAGQRSRIRKLVRLSREKAIRSEACKPSNNECSTSSDPAILDSKQDRISSVSIKTVEESTQVPVNSEHPSTVQEDKQALVNSGHDVTVQENKQAPVDLVVPKTGEEVPSSSLQEETIPGVDPDDKKIVENVYSLMRKEETFSGQVKLMEWILQIDNSALLHWFLTKGGLMILATWLSQAAVEEQTTVLLVILKVLCHLPLHKALPVQMSAILQTVNKLRFYRTSDISNRARVLLSRWSRLFVRSQGLKRPTSANSSTDAQKQIIRRQRISEILSDESWQSKLDIPEEILALDNEGSECSRIMEPKRALELLPSSCVESNKKHVRDIMSLKTKQRRKVLLVEQPDRKTTSRNVFISRPVLANHSRPISADDIQKAKMRAVFMQNKYGKIDASANGNPSEKINDQTISSAFQTTSILPVARLSKVKSNEDKKPVAPATETSNRPNTARETLVNSKTNSTSQEPLWEKLKSIHIPWQTPPEMVTNCLWRVGAGENSKEVEVQTQRTRRERESVYQNVDDIPSNPKDPWDIEMDFDDSLTVEIPTEQSPDAPDADSTEDSGDGGGGDAASLISPENNSDNAVDLPVATSAPSNPITATDAIPEPDLELLAVLLKNPDLVFALTSGQGNNLTSSETVALLDMLKKSDVGLAGMLNGFAGNATEKSEPMSLPSPTPPSDTTIGYRLESRPFAKNPPLQPHLRDKDFAASPAAPPILPPLPILSSATTILSMPHVTVTINPSSQHKPVTYLPSNKAPPLPHQVPATISPLQRFTNHATMQAVKNFPGSSMPSASSSPWRETLDFDQPPKLNPIPSIQPTLPTTARPHPPLLSEGPPFPRLAPPRWPPGAANVRRDPMPDSWNGQTDGLLGVRSLNSRLPANQHNYSSSAGPVRALPVLIGRAAEETEILDESDRETWSPERSPSLFGEFRSTRNFPESRRDHGRNNRPEWHRPHNSGQRDRHRSSRRWRDWDRDRGRDWRR